MTIAAQDHEIWTAEEGAPAGPAFQIVVPSKSRPDLTYTIARDEQGTIWHVHTCELWRFSSRRMCSHVKRAIELAEQPEATFLEDTRRLFESMGGALMTGDDIYRFWAQTYNAALAAREIRFRQMRVATTKYELAAETLEEKAAAAFAAFDRGDPRERAA